MTKLFLNLRYCSSLLFLTLSMSLSGQSYLFKDFIVIDGTGHPGELKDIRVRGDKIVLMGNLIPQINEKIIEGHGRLVLAPGFIDTHSHHSRNLDDTAQFSSFLCQGITTLIVGQDGSSYLPIQDYFRERQQKGLPVNLASYAGHNTIRYEVMGNKDANRLATRSEVKAMKKLVIREIKSGALGLSTGLEYDPGIYSSKEEVMSLALAAARLDGRYISHLRSEDIHLESAIEEIIDIGKRTNMPVQISHLKIAMKSKWGKSTDIVQRLDQARAEGIQITADIYPYDFWLSDLGVQFPKRDFDNKTSAEFALRELTPPEGMILSRYDARPEWVGKSIADIALDRKEDPADTYMYLIKLAHEAKAEESVMGRSMTESDIVTFMQWPQANICSDGFGGGRHPRGTGSFPRVLDHYVKMLQIFPLEEAIRKMTSLSADHMGIVMRGKISHGYFADLVIIDPDMVRDRSTLQDPFALSEGIEQVYVNGQCVWTEARYTNINPGIVIKNKRYK